MFDYDGTLCSETPMPIQCDFILRRLVAMAEQNSALRTRQPWQAAFDRDYGCPDKVITPHYHGDGMEGLMSLAVAILIVVATTGIAIMAMLWVRRKATDGSYFNDGDRAAGVFGVLATGFAVLLGFVVFLAFYEL